MPKASAILAVVLALSSSSCFLSRTTVNEPIRRAELDWMVPGQTTAKEVVGRLGAPNEVIQLGNRTAYRYDFAVMKRAGFSIIILTFVNEDTRADRAWLFFDAKDVLTHAGSTLQSHRAEYTMPWVDVHEQ